MLQTGRLKDYFISPLVHTVAAHTALHRGDVPPANEHLVQAARGRPLLTYAIPSVAVPTLLELGRAYLMLDDAASARTILRQARGILQLRPDLGVLPDQAEKLHAKLETLRAGIPGVSTLTTAELRLLPLLPTHLSFREIGEQLHVSQHTVKPRRSRSIESSAPPHAARRSSGSKRPASSRDRPGPTLAGSRCREDAVGVGSCRMGAGPELGQTRRRGEEMAVRRGHEG